MSKTQQKQPRQSAKTKADKTPEGQQGSSKQSRSPASEKANLTGDKAPADRQGGPKEQRQSSSPKSSLTRDKASADRRAGPKQPRQSSSNKANITSRKTSNGRQGGPKVSGSSAGKPPWFLIVGAILVVALIIVLVIVGLTRNRGETVNAGSEGATVSPTATVSQAAVDKPTDVPASGGQEAAQPAVEMPEDPAARNGMYAAPPAMSIDPTKVYVATFTTEHGDIVVELFADKVPNTVNNFVFLAREGFYDGTTFHRVLNNFMAQGGDPTGTGSGGPGYQFADEFHPDLRHDSAGILSMANSGTNTNGSQFFITSAPTEWLNGRHTVFGKVVAGMDVLQQIKLRDPDVPADLETPGDTLVSVTIEERTSSLLPEPTPVAEVAAGSLPMPEDPISRDQMYRGVPEMVIDPGKRYEAVFEMPAGKVVVELMADKAPELVNSFVFLAREGFYDDTLFYYVVPGQAMLGGDPTGTGAGGPGYYLPAQYDPELSHDKAGVFSMVSMGLNDVTSHFLFTLDAMPLLDGHYVIVGQVTEGLEILQALEEYNPGLGGFPPEDNYIKTITIREQSS